MSSIKDWKLCNLDDLANLDVETLSASTPKDFKFYYLDISSAFEGVLSLPLFETEFRDAPSRARKVVHRHDVLMSMVRPNLKAFAYFDHTDEHCVASTGFAVLTAKEDTSARFLLYSILSEGVSRQIDSFVIGSNYPAINSTAVRSLEILAPPKPEQTKIAEILSTVDRAIEQTEALIAKQQRIKTGLMQDLLTRGIDEHGNLRSEQTHEFKDSPLGRIPVEWEPGTLGQMAEFLSGYAFKNQELTEHGWRVVRISNLHKPDFPFWHYEGSIRDSWVIRSGDILFSWAGVASSIDCVRYEGEDALLNQHIYNFKFPNEELKAFVYLFLQYFLPILRTEIEGGAGQLHLTKDKIQSIRIPSVPDHEMKSIVGVLEGVEESLGSYKRQLSKAKVLKTALMQDLLTGEVRVTPLLDGKEEVDE